MSTIADSETERLLGAARLARSDAGREWDHLSLFHGTMREVYSGGPSLTFGTGETAPVSYVQMRARAVFFQTLHGLVPKSTPALLTVEAYEIIEGVSAAINTWGIWVQEQADAGTLDPHKAYHYPPLVASQEREASFIRRWQDEHRLPDAWVADAARFTMTAAAALQGLGETYAFPLCVSDPGTGVHAGKQARNWSDRVLSPSTGKRPSRDLLHVFEYTPVHKLVDVPVYVDDLKHSPYENEDGYELEDQGEFGTFDPRTEKVDAALKRLMPALESRLRDALEVIEEEDRVLNDALESVVFRDSAPFEWLVRFQVLEENVPTIAKSEGLSESRIRTGIREIAELICLERRKERTGRPPGKRDSSQRRRTERDR